MSSLQSSRLPERLQSELSQAHSLNRRVSTELDGAKRQGSQAGATAAGVQEELTQRLERRQQELV